MVTYLAGNRVRGTNAERSAMTVTSGTLGSAVDGTNNGAISDSSSPINSQNSVSFDGNDYCDVFGTTSSYAGMPTADFTIAFWLNINGAYPSGTYPDDMQYILETSYNSSNNGITLSMGSGVNDGKFMLRLMSSGQAAMDDLFTNALIDEDSYWHHWVFRFDNTNEELKIYKDGSNTVAQTITYTVQITTVDSTTWQPLLFGRNHDINTNDRYLIGKLSDVGIWYRLITAGAGSEVTTLFNGYVNTASTSSSNTGGKVDTINVTSLKAYYTFDGITTGIDNSASNTIPLIIDGSIFYETDTNKEYVLYNNTWTEV
jgi:hypothetical protein